MLNTTPIEPIDYLIIGHIVQDVVPGGYTLGGTASYASLTARAMGLRVGIVTSINPAIELPQLDGISIVAIPSEYTTTFENIYTPNGRIQYLHHRAAPLDISMVPETWKNTPIVHLGPLCQEVDPKLVRSFPNSFIGITPQGWMRTWDTNKRVSFTEWYESRFVLENASAAVLSIEDIECNEERIEDMLTAIRLLVVTEGEKGARLYWNGDLRYFRPPQIYEGDATGAGDIFAAAFFARYVATRDPWEAARFATQLAANSVTRVGLNGVPTPEEVQQSLAEVV
ncbi:MAG: ribokinase [Anaerolineae bacterium]|nr:ribokinase [Anaerolineae bacterium]